jgi:Cellulose binding domain
MATPASATAFSTAMRRVVVTPTFAAGLGVVIAAAMAYPMAKTVISYGGTPPAGGNPCLHDGCAGGTDGSGSLATASPGAQLRSPSPTTDPDPAAPPAAGAGTVAAGQPLMQYQTLRQWESGFIGQITISDVSGSAPANWQLRLAYDSARIIGVWGGRWSSSGDHAVLVTPDDGDGNSRTGNGHVQVVVVVSGHPGPPSGCTFNGQACRTSQSGGGPAPGSPQPEHQQSGNQQPGNQQPGPQPSGDHFGR